VEGSGEMNEGEKILPNGEEEFMGSASIEFNE